MSSVMPIVVSNLPYASELGGVMAESKVLTTSNSTSCKSCYGAEDVDGQCCNTCEAVKDAYRKKGWALTSYEHIVQCNELNERLKKVLEQHEGCQISGYLQVNKVAGNFHIAPKEGFQDQHSHADDLLAFEAGLFNVSHTIHRLSFGEEFPGIVNPLDGTSKTVQEGR